MKASLPHGTQFDGPPGPLYTKLCGSWPSQVEPQPAAAAARSWMRSSSSADGEVAGPVAAPSLVPP